MELALIYILIAAVAYWIWRYRENQKGKRENTLYFRSKISDVETALAEADALFNPAHGFFTCHSLKQWMDKYATLKIALDDFDPQQTLLKTEEIDTIRNFRAFRMNAENLRGDYNKKFIQDELVKYDTFFSNIENRKLDLQQRTAIVTDEDNNLVIAGAGSGKTTTIVGKVKYILDRYKVSPNEILLISFTKNAASTLAERINIKGIEAKTFHKLGKDIIVACEARQIPI